MTVGGSDPWRWTWTNSGFMDRDAWLALGLMDGGGPPIDDEPWASIRSAIYGVARQIYRMEIVSGGGAIVLTGSVTSERVKRLLTVLLERASAAVRNDLEVAAPFECATGDVTATEPTADDRSVTRHPSITPRTAARVGRPFGFAVDLGALPDHGTQGGAVELTGLPPGWGEIRIDVDVFCDAIAFDDDGDRGRFITLFPDGSSRPAVFEGRVKPGTPSGVPLKLKVMFEQDGRHAGSAMRRIEVEPGDPSASSGPAARPVAAAGSVEILGQVRAPTLTINISETSHSGRLHWRLSAPSGDAPYRTRSWKGDIDLEGDAVRFARRLLRDCPNLRPGRKHLAVLRGIGEHIWGVSPRCFKDLYGELRTRHGAGFPIQIVTDEPHIPWELMHPDADAGIEGADHLFMTHPMARWFGGNEGGMRGGLGGGEVASFVPDYDVDANLPEALEEGRRLVADLGARACEASCEGFTGFLTAPPTDGPVSILHFAGHAASPLDGGDGSREGLRMVDGWVSATEIHSGVRLGIRDGTFVVLNACSAGAAHGSLGVVGGWPATLAMRGFGGVLAPIWAVQDGHASAVVLDQLAGLARERRTLGESLRDARVRYRGASATPYAYLCHGDVMARMAGTPGGQV